MKLTSGPVLLAANLMAEHLCTHCRQQRKAVHRYKYSRPRWCTARFHQPHYQRHGRKAPGRLQWQSGMEISAPMSEVCATKLLAIRNGLPRRKRCQAKAVFPHLWTKSRAPMPSAEGVATTSTTFREISFRWATHSSSNTIMARCCCVSRLHFGSATTVLT